MIEAKGAVELLCLSCPKLAGHVSAKKLRPLHIGTLDSAILFGRTGRPLAT